MSHLRKATSTPSLQRSRSTRSWADSSSCIRQTPSRRCSDLSRTVRKNGLIVFQEPDFGVGVIHLADGGSLAAGERTGCGETFRRGGVHHDIGGKTLSPLQTGGLAGPAHSCSTSPSPEGRTSRPFLREHRRDREQPAAQDGEVRHRDRGRGRRWRLSPIGSSEKPVRLTPRSRICRSSRRGRRSVEALRHCGAAFRRFARRRPLVPRRRVQGRARTALPASALRPAAPA